MTTKSQLRRAKCGSPGCEDCSHVIYLHAKCHLHSALEVCFDKAKDCLVIRCAKCKGWVADVAVGEAEREAERVN